MKSLVTVITLALMLVTFQAKAGYIPAAPCTVRVCFEISGKLGAKSTNCTSVGLTCLKITICKQVAQDINNPSPGTIRLVFEQISPSEINITFLGNGSTDQTLLIDEQVALSPVICATLKYKSITVMTGKYTSVKNADGSYTSKVKVISK